MRDDIYRRVDGVRPPRPKRPRPAEPMAPPVETPVAKAEVPVTVAPPVAPPPRQDSVMHVSGACDLPRQRTFPAALGLFFKRAVVVGAVVAIGATVSVRAQTQATTAKETIATSVALAGESAKQGKAALDAGTFDVAKQKFQITQKSLHEANMALAETGQVGGVFGSQANGSLTAGSQLLASAELLAESGVTLSGDLQKVREGMAQNQNDLLKAGEVLSANLSSIQAHLKEASDRLTLLGYTAESARRTTQGGELGDAAAKLRETMPKATASMKQTEEAVAVLPTFLGIDRFKQYLLWFQNPNELRATGGFIGTYGRLTLDKGAVKELLVDSIYNPANQANARIKDRAPQPYERFYGDGRQPVWAMQDANWSPHFPDSADRFQRYYELAGGPTTDGVLAINTFPIIEALRILGPIDMPEYSYTLDADNFTSLIQQDQLARGGTGDADPKKILRDFLPKMLAKVGNAPPETQTKVFQVFSTAAAKRDLYANFTNPGLQQQAERLNMAGLLRGEPAGLMVVDTNIAGLKSSQDVASQLNQHVTIESDGKAVVTAELTRKYTPTTESPPLNQNHSRFFLPKGSRVLETTGFLTDAPYAPVTVGEENDKTVVGGWTSVAPEGELKVKVRYELPKSFDLSKGEYPFAYRKQSGTSFRVETTVTLPEGYRWKGVDGWKIDSQSIRNTATADTDLEQFLRFGPA